MKFLVIGLGSMGKRRVRNLFELGEKDVIGCDLREDRRKETEKLFKIKTFVEIYETFNEKPDVFIISVPPDQHLMYQSLATEKGVPFFTEASVIMKGMEDLIEKVKKKGILGVPSSTIRFRKSVQKTKELIDNGSLGNPLFFTYNSSSYLPTWHLSEDPETYYAFKPETNGCREIVPVELTWLTWVFGKIKNVKSMNRNLMHFGDFNDAYQILLEFESGVIGHFVVNVVSPISCRRFTCVGEKGVIDWDWDKREIKFTRLSKERDPFLKTESVLFYETCPSFILEDTDAYEQMYVDEMRHFLKALKGLEQYHYSLEDDLEILKLLEKIEVDSDVNVGTR